MVIDSIGEIASRFNVSVADVRDALNGLGCEPALVMNGVRYYDDTDQRAIADGLRAMKDLRQKGRLEEDA